MLITPGLPDLSTDTGSLDPARRAMDEKAKSRNAVVEVRNRPSTTESVESADPGPAVPALILSGMRLTNERALPFVPGKPTAASQGRAALEVPHVNVLSLLFIVGANHSSAPGTGEIGAARKRLEDLRAKFLAESPAVAQWKRLEAQLAELRKELPLAERRPGELLVKVRQALLAGAGSDEAESEYDAALARIDKLKSRVKILEDAAQQAKRMARVCLYQALDNERAAIEQEAVERAELLVKEICLLGQAQVEELRAVDALAGFLSKKRTMSTDDIPDESVAVVLATL